MQELRGDSFMVPFILNFYIPKIENISYCCFTQPEALGFCSQLQLLC